MTCTVDGCMKPTYARQLCRAHWGRRRHEWPPRYQPPVHGTRKRYEKGCRCDDCCQRESQYRAEWRVRTGRTINSRVLGGES